MRRIFPVKTFLKQFLLNEQGAELAEYAVGVALLVAVALITYEVLGDAINDENTGTVADINNASWSRP